MKKVLKKYSFVFIALLLAVSFVFLDNNVVYADFWNDAMTWFRGGSEDSTMSDALSDIVGDLTHMIEVVGTAVIIIATVVLGIRYIFASAEGKSAAKESTMNLLVACILFFGWTNIQGMLYTGTTFYLYNGTNSVDSAASQIFAVFKFVAQAIALIGVIYVGIRYVTSGAEGKADFKSKSVPFMIGIILTFASVEVISLISDIINLK